MTREQANKEYRQLLHDWNKGTDEIIEQAKRKGRLAWLGFQQGALCGDRTEVSEKDTEIERQRG